MITDQTLPTESEQMTDQTHTYRILSATDVATARERARNGEDISAIATHLRVPYAALYSAVRGRTWQNVETPPVPGPNNTPEGAQNHRRKLTSHQVCEARNRARTGEPLTVMAERYGVSYSAMRAAVVGTTWREITSPAPVVYR